MVTFIYITPLSQLPSMRHRSHRFRSQSGKQCSGFPSLYVVILCIFHDYNAIHLITNQRLFLLFQVIIVDELLKFFSRTTRGNIKCLIIDHPHVAFFKNNVMSNFKSCSSHCRITFALQIKKTAGFSTKKSDETKLIAKSFSSINIQISLIALRLSTHLPHIYT